MCDLVYKVFQHPEEVCFINQTFISLIPKVDHVEVVNHFRPIDLCNVIYKVIIKTLANRLKMIMPSIITPTQCGFIPNCNSSNDIIVAQEILYKMRHSSGNKGFMAIKLDLQKAYDRLFWKFIVDSLKEIGLSSHFVNVTWHCISSVSINILWNGEKIYDFEPSRCIRQGDHLSLYLFVICIERLSHIIQIVVSQNLWKPISLSRGDPKITHLGFADDLFIFAETSTSQVEVINKCLNIFCASSGQKVSQEKTKIYFSKNVNHVRVNKIASAFDFSLLMILVNISGFLFSTIELMLILLVV